MRMARGEYLDNSRLNQRVHGRIGVLLLIFPLLFMARHGRIGLAPKTAEAAKTNAAEAATKSEDSKEAQPRSLLGDRFLVRDDQLPVWACLQRELRHGHSLVSPGYLFMGYASQHHAKEDEEGEAKARDRQLEEKTLHADVTPPELDPFRKEADAKQDGDADDREKQDPPNGEGRVLFSYGVISPAGVVALVHGWGDQVCSA